MGVLVIKRDDKVIKIWPIKVLNLHTAYIESWVGCLLLLADLKPWRTMEDGTGVSGYLKGTVALPGLRVGSTSFESSVMSIHLHQQLAHLYEVSWFWYGNHKLPPPLVSLFYELEVGRGYWIHGLKHAKHVDRGATPSIPYSNLVEMWSWFLGEELRIAGEILFSF